MKPRVWNILVVTLSLLAQRGSVLRSEDWKHFRGNAGDGVSHDSTPPTSLDKPAWTTDLPGRGLSCPIVVDNRVVVTASSGYLQDRLHVICFEGSNGKQLWERQFWATGSTACHPKMANATPTPASDGQRIFATYSSNDVVCLDLVGNLLWYRGLTHDYPNASNSLGMSSSPVVVNGVLVTQVENDAESYAFGLDAASGATRWKIDRPRAANWTSPTILHGSNPEQDLVVLQSSKGLAAIRPANGEVVWTYGDGASTIPSSAVFENVLYVPSHGLTALAPLASSDAPEIRWRKQQLQPGTGSPLAYNGKVFTTNSAGVLTAADAKTGETAWRVRLKGNFSGSPIAAAGHIYIFNEAGLGQVVELGDKEGKVVSEHDLKETILCTPAIAGNGLYIRSDGHLWKFAR